MLTYIYLSNYCDQIPDQNLREKGLVSAYGLRDTVHHGRKAWQELEGRCSPRLHLQKAKGYKCWFLLAFFLSLSTAVRVGLPTSINVI